MRPFLLLFILVIVSCSTTQVERLPASYGGSKCHDLVLPFFAPKKRLVKSLDDFIRHTKLHIDRNTMMAIELLHHFPARFDLVNEELVQAFMKNHDQGKINPKWTQKGRRFIGERLYEFYGIPDSLLSEAGKAERKKVIDELNLGENIKVMQFFKRNGLLSANGEPNDTAIQLLEIEKIVDFVDRGMSSVSPEEFARPMDPGSKYIESRLSKFARYLEQNYKRITRGYEYEARP